MRPDSFMPFYWADFWEAVEGLPSDTIVGYQRALSHYWGHAHCKGLRDNDEFLRRLCRIDKLEWSEAKRVIFDNAKFFTMGEDGLWHQKRASQEWEKSLALYQAKLRQTAAATAARLNKGGRR